MSFTNFSYQHISKRIELIIIFIRNQIIKYLFIIDYIDNAIS